MRPRQELMRFQVGTIRPDDPGQRFYAEPRFVKVSASRRQREELGCVYRPIGLKQRAAQRHRARCAWHRHTCGNQDCYGRRDRSLGKLAMQRDIESGGRRPLAQCRIVSKLNGQLRAASCEEREIFR